MPSDESVATWAWNRQGAWSQGADQGRSRAQRSRTLLLVLTVVGATCALAGSQLHPVNVPIAVTLGVIGALSMAGAGLTAGLRNVEEVRDWTQARAVSEAIKSEIFLYLTAVDPYDTEDRDTLLDANVQTLERGVATVLTTATDHAPSRPLPPVQDVESYIELRVRRSQLQGFYAPRAQEMRRRLQSFKRAGVALALTAAALAALTTVSPTTGAWAALVTTVAGAAATYAASEHYETLWIEYTRTAEELQRLIERRTAPDGSRLTDEELIKHCEAVISAQNRAWLATWSRSTSK